MRLMRPCFWYLACSIVFGFVGYISIKLVPDLMEHFRPNSDALMPVPFINIKQDASIPAWVSFLLLCLFVISCFRADVHSSLAIKLVSFVLMIFLILCSLQLFMALTLVGEYGVLPR